MGKAGKRLLFTQNKTQQTRKYILGAGIECPGGREKGVGDGREM